MHENSHKNLHNEQSSQQKQKGHKQKGFKMDVGSANKLGVEVVGSGAALRWRVFNYTLRHRSPNMFLPISLDH